MVGSKPNPYLSEEARLEAQRRMLAERYGLLSDSDDNESAGEENESPADANGLSNGNSTSHTQPNGQPPTEDKAPPPVAANADDPAPSEAATYGDSSPAREGDLPTVLSHENVQSADTTASAPAEKPASVPKRGADGRATSWRTLDLTDGNGRILAHYEYSVPQKDAVGTRDMRLTPITSYNSQFLEKHRRKIAVNDQIITYAVGGHIRALLRNSGIRALLKGHDSAVADIEFLGHEKRLEETASDSISVLGSVAEDGSVYVWKLVRNDEDKDDKLEVADAIRFEHPDIGDRRSYNRISFRPGSGSIIAEKGIGVAMILVDRQSPDVRFVELVKMNEKMMVRDKFLRAQKEIGSGSGKDASAPIDSAAWLSERMVATSRCGRVHLWNTDGTLATCIATLPREKTTRVTSLHALSHEALLLEIESGRELEVWVAAGFAPEVDTASLELRQTIKLLGNSTPDVYTVTAVDPFEELVVLSNVKGSSLFVLHFNRVAQAFDAITEVPVKQPVLSFCMTRNVRRSASQALGKQVLNAEPIEEVGLWCVQPKNISLFHLPARECSPTGFVKPEVFPKSTRKAVMTKVERGPSIHVATTASGPVQTLPPLPLGQSAMRNMVNPGRSVSGVASGNAIHNRSNTPATVMSVSAVSSGSGTPGDSSKKSGTASSGSSAPVPSTHVQGLSSGSAEPPPNADKIADSILEGAKKAIESFEQDAGQRINSEKARLDRLADSVATTARTNLERYVNTAMKKVLAETMIPGMSRIMADVRKAITKEREDPKVTTEYFEATLEKCRISESFSSACQEMERQVSTSVSQSMSSKYDALIFPIVGSVNDAAEDLQASMKMLTEKMSEIKPEDREPEVVEIGPEDVRKTIEEEINSGNIDSAFQTALDKEDVSLVTWLCAKFEVNTFFETHTLSQISLLSLAQQLGHGVGDGDVMMKVEWLRELMLVLEPESEEIDEIAQTALKQLQDNVVLLRQNKEVLNAHEGLEKSLKTLGRLISSHLPN